MAMMTKSDTTNAKNVQVEVTKRDGSPLNVYAEKSEGVVIADNQALIPLAAQMASCQRRVH